MDASRSMVHNQAAGRMRRQAARRREPVKVSGRTQEACRMRMQAAGSAKAPAMRRGRRLGQFLTITGLTAMEHDADDMETDGDDSNVARTTRPTMRRRTARPMMRRRTADGDAASRASPAGRRPHVGRPRVLSSDHAWVLAGGATSLGGSGQEECAA
jgi:hypothetical protein